MTQLNLQPLRRQPRSTREQQAGVALLIAIFTLLIISAAAAALVMSSGTESSLAANYRSSASVYYAGLAGLEEARGRLLPSNPNFFNNTVANFVTVVGNTPTLAVGQVRYIVNPLPGETVAPTTVGNPYYDSEYQREWGIAVPAGNTQIIPSVSTQAGVQGPMFKWVRITAATEQSINLDVNQVLPLNNTTALSFDPSLLNATSQAGTLTMTPSSNASQVFQIAADAVLPNGTQKIMEYVVTPVTFNLNLQSPLTIPGTVGSFSGGNSNNYQINGNDGSGSAPAVAGCTPNGPGGPAVAVSNGGSATTVDNGFPRPTHYTGTNCSYYSGNSGCVGSATLPSTMSSPAQLEQSLQTVAQNSNVCLVASQAAANAAGCTSPTINSSGSYSFSDIVSGLPGGSWPNPSTNPQIVYVDGNLDISGNNPGSGILVVTGNLTYDGNSSWNGIILVVGQGTTTFNINGGGNGQFNGAIFVATTKDANGNTLPNFGTADYNVNGGGGSGLYYNSCWINSVQKPTTLRVVSFREISN